MPKLLILLSGHKRAGKNHIAKLLAEQLRGLYHTTTELAFADPMKRIIATTFGITLNQLEEYKNDTTQYLVHTDNAVSNTNLDTTDYRTILQRFGTEAMKPEFGTDVWGQLMSSAIQSTTSEIIIIPDFRYDAELDFLRSKGFNCTTVHIHNALTTSEAHSSEKLPLIAPDFIINNTLRDNSVNSEVYSCTEYLKALL